MQQTQDGTVKLIIRAELVFLPVGTSFVEKACLAFGLGEQEALSLTLATEEILAYLCQWVAPGKELRIACRSGGYYVEEDIVFEAQGFDMRAFNITFSAGLDECGTEEETGVLIASRMVDRFQFFQEGIELRLVLIKEKVYPEASAVGVPVARPLEHFSVKTPDPEQLKLFVHLAREYYAPPFIPASFSRPGKVADMAARGDYHAAVAVDEAGHLGGGIVWRWEAQRLVEFYGPYLFNQPTESDMAQSLADTCLTAIARTRAIGLINRYPTPELDPAYFESLGLLSFCCLDGKSLEIKAYYRHLEEDPGLAVWAHPSLESFLAGEYQRLVFARDIMPVTDEGESTSPYSVLSADFDRPMERVTFHPVWMGKDATHILAAHVASVMKESITNIFFEMDLGVSWHCHFTPALLENGFEPRLVLPYAGRGDLVVFQHKGG